MWLAANNVYPSHYPQRYVDDMLMNIFPRGLRLKPLVMSKWLLKMAQSKQLIYPLKA